MSVEKIIEALKDRLKNKNLFAVFDRDGTLVPLNPRPEAAILEDDVKELLINLNSSPNTKVAILSARDLKQLRHDFKDIELILAGNYGLELILPNQEQWVQQTAVDSRERLLEAKNEIQKLVIEDSSLILEDHRLVLCLHWHLTPSERQDKVHQNIRVLKAKFGDLLFKALPTSYEIWPNIVWDKSNGLQQIISQLALDLNRTLILYVGDSEADEPAFRLINDQHGVTIRVGSDSPSTAEFHIELTNVKALLRTLLTHL